MGKKRILLSCGKFISTLDIARKLQAAGHEVFVADTSWWQLCRFSNKVKKNFVIPSPRFEAEKSIEALVKIIQENEIDLFIPTSEETLYVAQYLDRFPCEVCCSEFDLMVRLHSKWLFNQKLLELGFDAPRTFLIRCKEDFEEIDLDVPYAAKACYSRGSLDVIRVENGDNPPDIPIEPHNPWVAQEWLHGEKIFTYSICKNGKVHAHITYPLGFAKGDQYCLLHESVDRPDVLEWVESFVAKTNFTGQIGFDFIQDPDSGILYPIECNPRSTFAMQVLTGEQIDEAFTGDPEETLIAPIGARKQIAPGMLMWAWKGKNKWKFLKALFTTHDPILNLRDFKPFMMIPPLWVYQLAQAKKWDTNLISGYFYEIEWDGSAPETPLDVPECQLILN